MPNIHTTNYYNEITCYVELFNLENTNIYIQDTLLLIINTFSCCINMHLERNAHTKLPKRIRYLLV